MVGGIETISTLGMLFLPSNNTSIARFGIEFWQELEDFLGPILGPIVRGFFEPVYRAFEDQVFRRQFLNTVVWTAMIIGGLVFVIYEAPSFLSWVFGSTSSSARKAPTDRAARTRAQRISTTQHQMTESKVEEERERTRASVEASGVKVQSIIKRARDELILDVIVNNGSSNQIDMVVVDLDLPADINTSTGSFRMQRLGTIKAGESEIAQFRLVDLGGDITLIGGHVEFLGASYVVSKISLPKPEIVD
ncbi:MAG: hypothetical protein ACFFE2_08610 [Candidatus Thorarchaeota archaeon]